MSKRDKMRERARKELAKRENKKKKSSTLEEDNEETPSFLSGLAMIFFGSVTFSFFFSIQQPIVGVLASAAFILIGMSRIYKASAARNKPETLKN